jgi:hypothetical protein
MDFDMAQINSALVETLFPASQRGSVRLYLTAGRRKKFAEVLGVDEKTAMLALYNSVHPLHEKLRRRTHDYRKFLQSNQEENEDDEEKEEQEIVNHIPDFLASLVVCSDAYFRGWRDGDDANMVYQAMNRRINEILGGKLPVNYIFDQSSGLPSAFRVQNYPGISSLGGHNSQWTALKTWTEKRSHVFNSPILDAIPIRDGPHGIVRSIKYMAPFLEKDELIFKEIAREMNKNPFNPSNDVIAGKIYYRFSSYTKLAERHIEEFGTGLFVRAVRMHMKDPALGKSSDAAAPEPKTPKILGDKIPSSESPEWVFEIEKDDEGGDSLEIGISFENCQFPAEEPTEVFVGGTEHQLNFKTDKITYPLYLDSSEKIALDEIIYKHELGEGKIPLNPNFWKMISDVGGGMGVETETLRNADRVIACNGNRKQLAEAIGIPEHRLQSPISTKYTIDGKAIVIYSLTGSRLGQTPNGAEMIRIELSGGGRLDKTSKPTYLRDFPPTLVLTEGRINSLIRIKLQDVPIIESLDPELLQEMENINSVTLPPGDKSLPNGTTARVFTVHRYKKATAKYSEVLWNREIRFIESKDLAHDPYWIQTPLNTQETEDIEEDGDDVTAQEYADFKEKRTQKPQISSESKPIKMGLTLEGWTEAIEAYETANAEAIREQKKAEALETARIRKEERDRKQAERDAENAARRARRQEETRDRSEQERIRLKASEDERREKDEEQRSKNIAEFTEQIQDLKQEYQDKQNIAEQILSRVHNGDILKKKLKEFRTNVEFLLNELQSYFQAYKGGTGAPGEVKNRLKRVAKRCADFRRDLNRIESEERINNRAEFNRNEKSRESSPKSSATKLNKKKPRTTIQDRLRKSLKAHPNSTDIQRALYCTCEKCKQKVN